MIKVDNMNHMSITGGNHWVGWSYSKEHMKLPFWGLGWPVLGCRCVVTGGKGPVGLLKG